MKFDETKATTVRAEDLGSADLGKAIRLVTDSDGTVVTGTLKALSFDEFRVNIKHGRAFRVLLQVGSFEEINVASDLTLLVSTEVN